MLNTNTNTYSHLNGLKNINTRLEIKRTKRTTDKVIKIDDEFYVEFGRAKLIGIIKLTKVLKNNWKGYLGTLYFEEYEELKKQGRLVYSTKEEITL